MSYLIENLEEHTATSETQYFLDSNIWIKILAPRNKPKKRDKSYVSFFEDICSTKGQNIVVPAMVISEVMNRLLRDIHLPKFISRTGAGQPVGSNFYKDVFRPSQDYKIAYSLIADEFRTYLQHIKFINDEYGSTVKYKHILSHFDFNLDFNDCYYYFLSKKKNYSIVTDDKDFWVKDVRILTLNPLLLDKQRQESS